MLYNSPPFAVVGRKSLGITEPMDLEGRTLGAPEADGAYAQWPIFVAANGIDASKVTIENVGFPVARADACSRATSTPSPASPSPRRC